MADPKTVGTGPYRQDGAASPSRHPDQPILDEVGVVGGTLFERQSKPAETVIRLYGGLDLAAAAMLDEEQLAQAMGRTQDVHLDVTGLTDSQPEALRLFLDRQRSGQRLAQRLAIRINPAQVLELFPEQSPDG